jgi:hypothetical protein
MIAKITKWCVFIVIGLPFYFLSTSSSGGISGVSQGGCSCHGPQSSNTTVTITPALTSYSAGQKINFTITVANAAMNTAISGGGFNLATNIGSLTSLDAETQVLGGELTHTMRKPSSTGSVSWNFRWDAPSSGNTPLQFTIAGNAVDGTGSTNADEWNFGNVPAVPLPVTFVSFSGKKDTYGVHLDWQVEDMVNASHFKVQRSLDGLIFYTLANIEINNKKSYHYFDPLTIAGRGITYRIKAIDYDGLITESDMIVISQPKISELKIYPSIITDGKLMVSSSEADGSLTAQVFNLSGAMVMSQQVSSNTLDVSSLSKGMYIVKVNDGSLLSESKRIVID